MQVKYGNTRLTFGDKLITPYIDQVKIYDDYYTVKVALYFDIPFDLDVDEYFNSISPLIGDVCLFHIIDGPIVSGSWGLLPYSGTVSEGRTAAASSILSKKYSILEMWPRQGVSFQSSYYSDATALDVYGDEGWFLTSIPATDFTYSSFTEDRGRRVCKFIHEKELAFYDQDFVLYDTRSKIPFYDFTRYNLDYNLFCCTVPPGTVELGSAAYSEMFWSGESESSTGHRILTGDFQLAKSSISNLTHQQIFTTGSLSTSPISIYRSFLTSDSYTGQVVQSIDGRYYDEDKITLDEIRESIGNMLYSSSNEEVANAVNAVSFILAEYGETQTLLPQLYSFYKVAPYKGAATQAGMWFENVSNQMFRCNESVLASDQLKKEIVVTPTLLDLRSVVMDPYEIPDPSAYNLATDFIYCSKNNSLLHRSGYFTAGQQGVTQEYDSGGEFTEFTRGFFFFDYEKALRTQSQIALLLDYGRIEDLFDQSMVNQKFNLSNVKVMRYTWANNAGGVYEVPSDQLETAGFNEEDWSWVLTHETKYETSEVESWSYPKISDMRCMIDMDASYYTTYDFHDFTIQDSTTQTYNPYLYLRNWNLVTSGGLDGYRMMCFEFEHFGHTNGGVTTNTADSDIIFYEVEIYDRTAELYPVIVGGYEKVLTGSIYDYYEAANEFCSFNNIEGVFNDFFATNITAHYPVASSAPWFLGPLTYNIHLDLVTNKWNGNKETIVNEARKQAARISPHGGTLEELNAFYESMVNFYDTFYASGSGQIAVVYESLAASQTLNFGGDGNAYYFPLPEVDFLNLTPPTIKLINTTTWWRVRLDWGTEGKHTDWSSYPQGESVNWRDEYSAEWPVESNPKSQTFDYSYFEDKVSMPWGVNHEQTAEDAKAALLFYVDILVTARFYYIDVNDNEQTAKNPFRGGAVAGQIYESTEYPWSNVGLLAPGFLVGQQITVQSTEHENLYKYSGPGIEADWGTYLDYIRDQLEILAYEDRSVELADKYQNYSGARDWDGTIYDAFWHFVRIAWINDRLHNNLKSDLTYGPDTYSAAEDSWDTEQLIRDAGYYNTEFMLTW